MNEQPDYVPVSENVAGETVLGRVEAILAGGCPGPAGLGTPRPCALELAHEGDHVPADTLAGMIVSAVEKRVSALKAERDELLEALVTVEEYLARRVEFAGVHGRTVVLPLVRRVLAKSAARR